MSRSTAEIVKEYSLAQCRCDSARLREILAPNVRFHHPQSSYVFRADADGNALTSAPWDRPDPYVDGREALIASVERAYKRFFKQCEPPDFVHVVAEGDVGVVLSRNRAIMQDGSVYHQLYSFHVRVEDGLVAEIWEVHDTMYAFKIFLAQPTLETA
jgi:ketosteroid isomerase-like protein